MSAAWRNLASREAWSAASDRHQAARAQVKRLQDALAAADDALEFAMWDLAQHELSPGIPLYTQLTGCCVGVECHCDMPAPADGPPEYGPDDAEAQRIAETFADANLEHDRIEAEETGHG